MSKGLWYAGGIAGVLGFTELVEISKMVPGTSVHSALLVWIVVELRDMKRRIKVVEDAKVRIADTIVKGITWE